MKAQPLAGERLAGLYRRYGPTIYARCRRLLRDDAAAEDATQEVFLRVLEHIASAPDDQAALAWITGGVQELPGSIELDAVAGREQIFAIFSDAPLRTDAVRDAIARGADVSGLAGVRGVVTRSFVKLAP